MLYPEYLGDGAEAAPPSQRVPTVTHPGRAAPPGHPPPPPQAPASRRKKHPRDPYRREKQLQAYSDGPQFERARRRRIRAKKRAKARAKRKRAQAKKRAAAGKRLSRAKRCVGARSDAEQPDTPPRMGDLEGPDLRGLAGGRGGAVSTSTCTGAAANKLGCCTLSLAPRTATLMVLTLVPVTAPKPPATLPPRVCFTRRVRTKTMPTPAAQAPTLLHLPWARIVLTQTLPPPRG